MAGVCDYTLIDTKEKAETAIKGLRSSKLLSVGCEGVNLGRYGELCLLQIAVKDKVYLFDIVSLNDHAFDMGLREMFEDESVTKLFYDCRGDCSALQHQYSVTVKGIEDLQMLNTIHMKQKGKSCTYVTGLKKCLDFHLKGCGFSAATKDKMRKAFAKDKLLWKKRPLSDEYLGYAASGVYYLARLRESMYGSLGNRSDLIDIVKYTSKRYADFMRKNNACDGSNKYFGNARLPERIVPEIRRDGGKMSFTPFSDKTGRLCISCNWKTDTRPDGQCNRCYAIGPLESFTRQPVAPKRRHSFISDEKGPMCKSCMWRTNTQEDGPCQRCYELAHPGKRFANNHDSDASPISCHGDFSFGGGNGDSDRSDCSSSDPDSVDGDWYSNDGCYSDGNDSDRSSYHDYGDGWSDD